VILKNKCAVTVKLIRAMNKCSGREEKAVVGA
jgi:hypothetical protein